MAKKIQGLELKSATWYQREYPDAIATKLGGVKTGSFVGEQDLSALEQLAEGMRGQVDAEKEYNKGLTKLIDARLNAEELVLERDAMLAKYEQSSIEAKVKYGGKVYATAAATEAAHAKGVGLLSEYVATLAAKVQQAEDRQTSKVATIERRATFQRTQFKSKEEAAIAREQEKQLQGSQAKAVSGEAKPRALSSSIVGLSI